jgi:hypothetical protein
MTVTTDESVRAPTGGVPDVWTRLMACSPYTGRPAAIRDVVAYTRAGGWVPGEHAWWVELPGYAYGWLIAIPVTIALYGISWVLQRPSRLAMVALVAGLLWWAGG